MYSSYHVSLSNSSAHPRSFQASLSFIICTRKSTTVAFWSFSNLASMSSILFDIGSMIETILFSQASWRALSSLSLSFSLCSRSRSSMRFNLFSKCLKILFIKIPITVEITAEPPNARTICNHVGILSISYLNLNSKGLMHRFFRIAHLSNQLI